MRKKKKNKVPTHASHVSLSAHRYRCVLCTFAAYMFSMNDEVMEKSTLCVRFNTAAIMITDVSNWLISSLYPTELKHQILGFFFANGERRHFYLLKLSCKTFASLMCWHVRVFAWMSE